MSGLAKLLAKLYPDLDRVRLLLLGDKVGIDPDEIDFRGDATLVWHRVLDEAWKRERVKRLVDLVSAKYPERDEELSAEVQLYLNARENGREPRSSTHSTNESSGSQTFARDKTSRVPIIAVILVIGSLCGYAIYRFNPNLWGVAGRLTVADANPAVNPKGRLISSVSEAGHGADPSLAPTPRGPKELPLIPPKQAQPGEKRNDNALKMVFCWCPAGKFLMGSPRSEKRRSSDKRKKNSQVSASLMGFLDGSVRSDAGPMAGPSCTSRRRSRCRLWVGDSALVSRSVAKVQIIQCVM